MAWVADEAWLRPRDYPPNPIGGRTLDLLRGLDWPGVEPEAWAGTIVVTTAEDLSPGRWCGAIWPLDDEQRWLIVEAHRAARGDPDSVLFSDEDRVEG
ncbi:MAG TPA: hypothetical protein VKY90_13610 [Candidatus Dormibacteraeota bacterium]|nr:hypothetical protein [Candidatus Dormibacteraeota bacterium]